MNPQVSVLIPTYNRADLLPETIESLLVQRYPPAEIVLVDDGSTDDTQKVVSGFGRKVRYQRIENSGVCRARNVAAELATSPYFAFCDSDDLWRDDKLAEQMELHIKYPDLEYSFTNFVHVVDGVWSHRTKFDDAPPGLFNPVLAPGQEPVVSSHPLFREIVRFQPIFPSTILMTRNFFYRSGKFDEQFGRCPSEDLEFTLRCVRQAPIGIIRKPVVGIRKHDSNFSGDIEATDRGVCEILEYARNHYDIDKTTRQVIEEDLICRRIALAHGPFRRGDFSECIALLSQVPREKLDSKSRLKLAISRCPAPVAHLLRKALVRS